MCDLQISCYENIVMSCAKNILEFYVSRKSTQYQNCYLVVMTILAMI